MNRVTQQRIHQELKDKGVQISQGQIDKIIKTDAQPLKAEKDAILQIGLRCSEDVRTDDTGARHRGKNGYGTVIQNDLFAFFKSTDSKSRINFFEIMRGDRTDYIINSDSFEYLDQYSIKKSVRKLIDGYAGTRFEDKNALENFFHKHQIVGKAILRLLTESMLYAILIESGIPKDLLVLSDGAPQFDVFNHAMCWIHAERNLKKLVASDEEERKLINELRSHVWTYYSQLKMYKQSPSTEQKKLLLLEFDRIFGKKTSSSQLNKVLKAIYSWKEDLLKVLKYPKLPLNNNGSERDIREYVIKRKISGGTRSDNGREARDTYTSLSKTCKKLGISFWDYLGDRISGRNNIPYLPEIIKERTVLLSDP